MCARAWVTAGPPTNIDSKAGLVPPQTTLEPGNIEPSSLNQPIAPGRLPRHPVRGRPRAGRSQVLDRGTVHQVPRSQLDRGWRDLDICQLARSTSQTSRSSPSGPRTMRRGCQTRYHWPAKHQRKHRPQDPAPHAPDSSGPPSMAHRDTPPTVMPRAESLPMLR